MSNLNPNMTCKLDVRLCFSFWDNKLQHHSFLFLSSNPPIYLFLFTFKFMTSFFTNFYCMHICIHTHIPTYHMFSPYNVIFMCVFRVDCLALDNQLVFSFLGKITSPVPNFPQLLIVLCAGLRPCALFYLYSICRIYWYHPSSGHIWGVVFVRIYGCSFQGY